jgi:hypothetical protein
LAPTEKPVGSLQTKGPSCLGRYPTHLIDKRGHGLRANELSKIGGSLTQRRAELYGDVLTAWRTVNPPKTPDGEVEPRAVAMGSMWAIRGGLRSVPHAGLSRVCAEPPDTDPYVRWCGTRAGSRSQSREPDSTFRFWRKGWTQLDHSRLPMNCGYRAEDTTSMQSSDKSVRFSYRDSNCEHLRCSPCRYTRRYPLSPPIQAGRLHFQYSWGSPTISR